MHRPSLSRLWPLIGSCVLLSLLGISPWGLDFGQWQVALPSGSVRVGRAPDCDVVVPSPRVSRYHAELTVDGQGARVRDLGSTNGTQVNDQWVSAPVAVAVGDEIQVGPARFRLAA